MSVNALPEENFMRKLREGLITKEGGFIDKEQPIEKPANASFQQSATHKKDPYDVTQFG